MSEKAEGVDGVIHAMQVEEAERVRMHKLAAVGGGQQRRMPPTAARWEMNGGWW